MEGGGAIEKTYYRIGALLYADKTTIGVGRRGLSNCVQYNMRCLK